MLKSNNRIVSAFFYILLATVVFFIILAVEVYPLRPVGAALDQWQVKKQTGWQDVRLPLVEMVSQEWEVFELRTSFQRVDADTLVIPRQSGNAIEVRLNGRLIYKLGDFSQPTANLWNYVHLIQLPEPLAEDNLLEIWIASSYYGSGLNSVPYLCRYEQCAGRVTFLNWIYSDAVNAIFGAGFITSLILIAMAFIRRQLMTTEFFIGLALLVGVFYLQDLPFRLTSGSLSTFLWLKKGFLFSGYLAALFFLCGIELQYWKRITLSRWLAILVVLVLLALIASPDIHSMGVIQTYANSGLLFFLIVIAAMIIRSKQRPSWMLFPATLLSLSILLLLITLPLGITWPIMIPPVFVMTTMMVGIRLILEYNQLFQENINLNRAKNIDPLTGALNRNSLPEVRARLHNHVVMIDLDGFKSINDRFGHAFGDQVLTEFAQIVRRNLRQNDLVIRYGGDEFVLVVNGLPKTQQGYAEIKSIIERIEKQYGGLHSDIFSDIVYEFSYGIAEIEKGIEEAIGAADQKMYLMKNTEKKIGA